MEKSFRDQLKDCEENGNLRHIDILPFLTKLTNNLPDIVRKLHVLPYCIKYNTACNSGVCRLEREKEVGKLRKAFFANS